MTFVRKLLISGISGTNAHTAFLFRLKFGGVSFGVDPNVISGSAESEDPEIMSVELFSKYFNLFLLQYLNVTNDLP